MDMASSWIESARTWRPSRAAAVRPSRLDSVRAAGASVQRNHRLKMRNKPFVPGSPMPTRRRVLAGALAHGLGLGLAGTAPAFAVDDGAAAFERELEKIESRIGGTIGAAALDTASGRLLAFNADRRMAMCSVFKL